MLKHVIHIGLTLAGLLAVGCSNGSPRTIKNLNRDWAFIRQNVEGASEVSFDDSKWQRVNVPHTWNAQDGRDGGNDYYRGPGWYRRHLDISESQLNKSLFLRFDGAALVADVFVNGQAAGQHRGGFGAFCFDVSQMLKRGDNVIAVRVDNAKRDDVTPISGDFTIHGGIYRDVNLLILNPTSISPMDDASCGIYLKQVQVSDERATVEVTTKLRGSQDATLKCVVTDSNGKAVHRSMHHPTASDFSFEFEVARPRLWNGLKDPHLYNVQIDVIDESTHVVDRVSQPLGLRYFRVDPRQGFLLNGKPYALHGVNRHQERLGKGWATSAKDVDEDYALMHEMGVTAVRGAHYQHPQYELNVCDKLGMVVWAELAMVNYMTDSPAFRANAKQQLRELIKQNYNHPSIMFWSLYNELRLQEKRKPEDFALVVELNELAHQLDPTRPTVGASNMPPDHPLNLVTDVVSFNRYWGWYRGELADWGPELDKIRATIPADRAIAVSEYGAGASIKQHEPRPTTRPPTTGPWHPEEWQSIVHENAYGAMKEKPWLWGTFLWVMFDFASDARTEGDTPGVNDKGMVTGDRKTRKDAFYFYKANWTSEPFVHITSKRFSPRQSGQTEVKVYSNADEVELFVNGQAMGRVNGKNGIFIWPNVRLQAGKNSIRAISTGKRKSSDQCVWDAN